MVSNTYDSNGRVVSQINGRGNTTTFAYDTPDSEKTTVTDSLGFTTIHTHDNSYRLTQVMDTNGSTTVYTYDTNSNRTGITDKNNMATGYAYDANGNVTSKTDALGNSTTIEYNALNNPTKRTDSLLGMSLPIATMPAAISPVLPILWATRLPLRMTAMDSPLPVPMQRAM